VWIKPIAHEKRLKRHVRRSFSARLRLLAGARRDAKGTLLPRVLLELPRAKGLPEAVGALASTQYRHIYLYLKTPMN
jgi:hypothetical protein